MRTLLPSLYPRYQRWLSSGYRAYRTRAGKLYLDLSESAMMLARVLRGYETEHHAALESLLEPGAVFVDVGANKGDFSLLAARLVGSAGRVLAVEPEPQNRRWLDRTIELNGVGDVVSVAEVALDAEDGSATLHLGEMSGWHSLTPGASTGGAVTVATRRLDSLLTDHGLDRVDVVKIDVEGAELRVLAGASGLLARAVPPVLLLDVHPHRGVDPLEVERMPVDFGFTVTPVDTTTVCSTTREMLARRWSSS